MDLHFTRYYWAGVHLVWINYFVLKNPTDCCIRNLKITLVSYCLLVCPFFYQQLLEKKPSMHPFETLKQNYLSAVSESEDVLMTGKRKGFKGAKWRWAFFGEEDSAETFWPIKSNILKQKWYLGVYYIAMDTIVVWPLKCTHIFWTPTNNLTSSRYRLARITSRGPLKPANRRQRGFLRLLDR